MGFMLALESSLHQTLQLKQIFCSFQNPGFQKGAKCRREKANTISRWETESERSTKCSQECGYCSLFLILGWRARFGMMVWVQASISSNSSLACTIFHFLSSSHSLFDLSVIQAEVPARHRGAGNPTTVSLLLIETDAQCDISMTNVIYTNTRVANVSTQKLCKLRQLPSRFISECTETSVYNHLF